MRILHLFSGYNTFTDVAHKQGHNVISVDIKKYNLCTPPTFKEDYINFNVKQFPPGYFDFILVGFPCTIFSKVQPKKHFINKTTPVTIEALTFVKLMQKLKSDLDYCCTHWIIENPTSALFENQIFKDLFAIQQLNRIRLHQFTYGHQAFKQTDFLTNNHNLLLTEQIYRVNGKYSKATVTKLTLKKRQSYPPRLCETIINYMSN